MIFLNNLFKSLRISLFPNILVNLEEIAPINFRSAVNKNFNIGETSANKIRP